MTMCEATKRMKIMLDNEEKNPLSKAILILGETLDSSLTKIEETQKDDREYVQERFDEIKELLEKQSEASNKRHEESIKRHKENEERLAVAINNRKTDCAEHKKEIDKQFTELREETEEVRFAKKHNKLIIEVIKWASAIIMFLLGLAFGHGEFFK